MPDSIIYTRVSSEKQKREGNGSSSQEQRCRSFIKMQGYHLLRVFGDEAVSGAVLERPGMRELLAFLRSRRAKDPVMVVVDDISRLARDVKTHIELRTAIQSCGGKLVSPSFNFEESAIGQFMETIFAGMAQYGRSGNREQVLNRQLARLEQGFWTFPASPGYAYKRHPTYKKLLVPDGMRSGLIKEALEGFANNRFATQREIAEHLKRRGYYPETGGGFSSKYEMAVRRILDNIGFYAGFIEYPEWGVERRDGMHEPLISRSTLSAIADRLSGNVPRPIRADNREDFLLRNYVRCSGCGRPLTGSLAKSGRYARYHCYKQDCPVYGRTISRDRLHEEFESLLLRLRASAGFLDLATEVTRDLWRRRIRDWDKEAGRHEAHVQDVEGEISALVKRIGKTADESLVSEYEREIKELKKQRDQAVHTRDKYEKGPPDFSEALRRVGTVLDNPYLIWKEGSREQKRMVCSLVFAVPPTYDRETGFGTISLTLPYLISRQYADCESSMVDLPQDTWYQFIGAVLEWRKVIPESLTRKRLKPSEDKGWLLAA